MDIEQLKLIFETLSGVTGAAKSIGVFWLSIYLFEIICIYALGGAAVFALFKVLSRLVSILNDNTFACSLRHLVCPGEAYGVLTKNERELILTTIKRGLKEAKTDV